MLLKIYEGEDGTFKDPKDAIKYMFDTNFRFDVTMYDINNKTAYRKTHEIYDTIKEYNKGKPLNEQILPTNPYRFRGIVGCLGVECYTIGLGTYERNHECIALFTGYNDSVLDTSNEEACIRPSLKAISSLSIIPSII